jgi:hypothetical protein
MVQEGMEGLAAGKVLVHLGLRQAQEDGEDQGVLTIITEEEQVVMGISRIHLCRPYPGR